MVDCALPLKSQFISSKHKLNPPPFRLPPSTLVPFQACRQWALREKLKMNKKKIIRFFCELEASGKVNGVLSGDSDPRFLDRIFGPESSGKTTLALHAIAEVQKLGGNAMLVDAEHAFDPAYSKALGVDVENLIVCQPDNGEMALEIADRMCRSGAIDLICVDSVSALTPRAEIEGEIGMQQMGLQARLMSQALRKMSGNASKAGCTLIFLNQIRYKIGVYYGNPEVTSGGIALKFFASLRLEIRPTGKIKSAKGDEDIGVRVRVRVQKSKVSRPYKQAEFEIIFGVGVSKLGCLLDFAEMMGVVVKKGSWYSYGDNRLGQGRDRALQYLADNPILCVEIEKIVQPMMVEGIGQAGFPFAKHALTHQDEDTVEEMQ
ncbi:DNA repair protein recA homolog 1, chloroplastic isoform X3 [Malania oleifera]|uniref:DNA repair protein recA homolog 1, chloroplastic isoform X3 n=1 Tax=Malania oleifera TaxID=397392 RepID=UPI0025AE676D|nr:DNA repair protein recA homolog 1, chloroplastic isoform X3 [Malania oleifera]